MTMATNMFGTNASVFDSHLYGPLFAQNDMKAIWTDENLISEWLTFESTIAKVQAELGIIPADAALAIKTTCANFKPDWSRLSSETESVGMAIKPLIDQIAEQGNDSVKQYLHWGCTTQDLLDTSLAMRLKSSLNLVRKQLVDLGLELAKMAEEHAQTVCVARTNSMDALPSTWGLQVSSYLQEITRHLARLDDLYPRAITGLYGGAVGNFSSIGLQGLQVRKALFAALELNEPKGLNNASLDHVVEVVQFFALIHGTLCRIANDIETMGRAAIAEVREGESGGGSSTMPHKANPRASNMIQTLSRMGWMYASSAPNMMDQQDLRAASMRVLNWSLVPESAMCISTALDRAQRLMRHLIVNKDQMRANFADSRHFIMSEAMMMTLAQKVGREKGYQLMKEILAEADSELTFLDIVQTSEELKSILTEQEITAACDPLNYLGCNQALIEETLLQFNAYLYTNSAVQ